LEDDVIARVLIIIAVSIGCGVKGYPRPVEAALPKPVAVPGQAASKPVEPLPQ
jgi:hypothetical protein